jgi:integrase
MILLGLRTGLRQGELLALRWDDIDLVAGRLTVRRAVARGIIGTPKSGKSREVALSDEAIAALRPLPSRFAGELVFPGKDGRLLTKGECKHPLWRACRKAGLRRIGWHCLRHTFASHLVMRGAPIKAVQELLGHATMEMSLRYSHLSPDIRRDAVRLLDAPATPAADEAKKKAG